MHRATILIIEDDADIMRANRMALELEGYRVLEAGTLAKGREVVEAEEPDLILLDIMLPDGNGLEYCQQLRGGGIRILFLSALNSKEDTLTGLRAGGDDYITKPYLIDEMLARVEVLLRRGKLTGGEEPPLCLGDLEISFTSRRAFINGADLLLEPKEFALLEILAKNRGHYVAAEEMYGKVWGMDAVNDVRTVKVRISSLRQKLGAGFDIEALRGAGYRLVKKADI